MSRLIETVTQSMCATLKANLAGDLMRLGGDGERPLPGDTGRLLGGVSPPRR